jgi:hypothetical protein
VRSATSGRPARRRLARRGVALAVLTVAVTGCAGGNGAAVAADVARRFHAAVAQHDGAAACGLLAPQTRAELEQSAGRPCPAAVLQEGVPRVGPVRSSSMFGGQAQVRLDGDTVFLAEFPGGWRVVAVACTPRPPLPYDCQIKGV